MLFKAGNFSKFESLFNYSKYSMQHNKSSFKSFLELEPQIRDILFKFNESKYAICLKLMDQIKDHLLLDMYLSPHVNTLYSCIRQRALRQVHFLLYIL